MEDRVTEKELAAAAVAPRVRLADIKAEIAHVAYFNAAKAAGVGEAWSAGSDVDHMRALGLLTFCVVVLRNGFTVTGQSACASPENFDAEIGQRLALEDAERQLWPLLGFRLRDQLAGISAPVGKRNRVALSWVDERHGVFIARHLLARDGVVFYRVYDTDPLGMWMASAGHAVIGTYPSSSEAMAACETHAAQVSA